MKILVTGSKGQLGKTFEALFSNNNDQLEFFFTAREDLDISIEEDLKTFFETHTFAYCINLAAYTNVEEAEENSVKAFEINASAVKNLALLCQQYKVKLLHISTDYVFDGNKKAPYCESDKTNPLNIYGKSKLLGEQHIKNLLSDYYIIRTSWLYSAYNRNFVKTIIDKARQKIDLRITNTQRGIPTSCIELSKFIYYILINQIDYGVYHFTSKGETTWYDFAKHIVQSLNNKTINISPSSSFKTKAKRPKYSVLSTEKAEEYYSIPKTWEEDVDAVLLKLKSFD